MPTALPFLNLALKHSQPHSQPHYQPHCLPLPAPPPPSTSPSYPHCKSLSASLALLSLLPHNEWDALPVLEVDNHTLSVKTNRPATILSHISSVPHHKLRAWRWWRHTCLLAFYLFPLLLPQKTEERERRGERERGEEEERYQPLFLATVNVYNHSRHIPRLNIMYELWDARESCTKPRITRRVAARTAGYDLIQVDLRPPPQRRHHANRINRQRAVLQLHPSNNKTK